MLQESVVLSYRAVVASNDKLPIIDPHYPLQQRVYDSAIHGEAFYAVSAPGCFSCLSHITHNPVPSVHAYYISTIISPFHTVLMDVPRIYVAAAGGCLLHYFCPRQLPLPN